MLKETNDNLLRLRAAIETRKAARLPKKAAAKAKAANVKKNLDQLKMKLASEKADQLNTTREAERLARQLARATKESKEWEDQCYDLSDAILRNSDIEADIEADMAKTLQETRARHVAELAAAEERAVMREEAAKQTAAKELLDLKKQHAEAIAKAFERGVALAEATEAKMADALQKASEEADARLAAEAARRRDVEREAAELTQQLQAARAAKAAADAEAAQRVAEERQARDALVRANMAVSATLTSETIQRKEAEQKTSDLTERLAAAAEAKIDDAIRISDLKTLLWEEQARTKAVQALSRPTIATDANKQQEASDRASEVAIAQVAEEKAQRLEAEKTVKTLTARLAAADLARAAASATALELQSALTEERRCAAASREEAGCLKVAVNAGREAAFRREQAMRVELDSYKTLVHTATAVPPPSYVNGHPGPPHRVLSPSSCPVFPVPMYPPPPGPYPVPGPPTWAGPMAPAFGPPTFLPAPFAPMYPVPPPFHPQPICHMPGPAFSPLRPVDMHSTAQAMLPPQATATSSDAAPEAVLKDLHRPAQPMSSPQAAAACPVPDTRLAARPTARRTAPAIITPPHPEGLKRLLEQRQRDGAVLAVPVDKPRGPAVVTPLPSDVELACLHAILDRWEAAAARQHLQGLLSHAAQRWVADGCPGGLDWSLSERLVDKAASEAGDRVASPVVPEDAAASPAAAPTPASVVAGRSPLAERRDNQQTVGAAIAPPVPAPERRRRKRGGRGARGRGSQNLERPPVQEHSVRDNQENAGMVSKEERTEVQRLWNDLPAAALPLTRNPFAALTTLHA